MKTIVAKTNTKFKKLPIQSSELKPDQMVAVTAGKTYGAQAFEPAENRHIKVTLAANSGTFYAFSKDWDGLPSVMPEGAEEPLITQKEAEAIFGNFIREDELADLNRCLHFYQINTPP